MTMSLGDQITNKLMDDGHTAVLRTRFAHCETFAF